MRQSREQDHLRETDDWPTDTIAILLPHENGKHTGTNWVPWITTHLTTIAEIEKLTGINFLPGV